MIHSDPALIARVELAEAELQRRWALAAGTSGIGYPAAWTDLPGGGVAVDKGPDAVWSRAYAIGLHDSATAQTIRDAVDQAERFFARLGKPARIDLGPTVDPALMAILHDRRYSAVMYDTIVVMPVDRAVRDHASAGTGGVGGIEVRVADDPAAWAARLVEAFTAGGPPEDLHDRMADKLRGFAAVDSVTCLEAVVDGRPAGGAFVAVINGVGLLHSAGTLPAFRSRGVQRAMLVERARLAADAGAQILCAQSDARNGPSLRNMERFGLKPCCSRVTVEAPFVASS